MSHYTDKKLAMQADSSFRLLKNIYVAMDQWFLDPILGFFVPGLGDVITTCLTIPFIFTSIFKLRSIPLTLAIISNCLIDLLIGLIPIAGDIADLAVKSYKRNYYLIVGYVEGDPKVIEEINSKALWACVLITVLSIGIRLIAGVIGSIFTAITPKSCTSDLDSPKEKTTVVATQTKPSEPKEAPAPSEPSTLSTQSVPSSTPVSSETTFHCANTGEDVMFDYGYESYSYGDYVLLSGDCGALGGYSGYNVVSYQKSTGTYNYVCFGAEVIVYSLLVISLGRRIVKEGDCEAENEYDYVYEYYSGTTNEQMGSQEYSGTIGKYRITMELAFDSVVPKAVGTYYYDRNGEQNRMIVFGDVSGDGNLVLKAYDTNFYDKPSETMVLTATGSGFSGYWERPNKDRLEVNLSR